MAARFNRDGHRIIDHRTWVLCSDGDLMEGISAEAASVAGHLGLGKLTWIWDDNRITIEGGTDLTVSEDVLRRFEAYGWQTLRVDDINDLAALSRALQTARTTTDRPTFIAVRSQIAFGAPDKQGSASSHGAPLGEDEIRGAKRAYGWPEDAELLVPDEVEAVRSRVVEQGRARAEGWQHRYDAWAAAYPDLAEELSRRLERRLPDGWERQLPGFEPDEPGAKGTATRVASGKVLNAIAGALGELITGSADLGPSCKTAIGTGASVAPGAYGERNIHFGIREHAMGAMLNGMSLHGGLRPVGSTFLVFSDYMRPAIRLAALMDEPSIFVFTHDSIWVGEDGPTHQPIEHVMALRLIPNLTVVRPADANEVAVAWRLALERTTGPTAIVLCRQGVPVLEGTREHAAEGVARGGYVLVEAGGSPRLVLLATGSEVQLAVAARTVLERRGTPTRVVSLPSWEAFAVQPAEYRRQVLPPDVPRIAVEAGVTHGWRDLVGDHGTVLGIDRFGASAPGKVVAERLGMTVDAVVEAAISLLAARDA
jgi:transketolase